MACVTPPTSRRCLESVTWADEIVVVDSFSKDRTAEICREYTNLVYEHEWLGYIGQKNLIRKMATHDWLFFVDADEEVSDELREQITRDFDRGQGDTCGYEFPRMVNYLGRWIRYGEWYPDIKLRLFFKDKGRSGGQEPHDQVFVNGPSVAHGVWITTSTHPDTRNHATWSLPIISRHARTW